LANSGWIGETPLWFYVLKEADARHDGERLRPAGGRIVGEVLTTLIDRDLGSFRAATPDWTPTLPTDQPARFGLAHLLPGHNGRGVSATPVARTTFPISSAVC
jgi:hypothetical protein